MTHDSGLTPFSPYATGFRESPSSGLLLPVEHSRDREVWTYDDWKRVDRAVAFLKSKGVQIYLRCEHTAACKKEPMDLQRQRDGGITLRCAHKDRVVSKSI